MDEEKLRIENARAYRDYSSFCAKLASGILIASGIGASLAAMSMDAGISLARLGLNSAAYEHVNSTVGFNSSETLIESGAQLTSGVKYGGALLMTFLGLAFILALEGYLGWRKSQAILNDEIFDLKWYRFGQVVITIIFLYMAISILI